MKPFFLLLLLCTLINACSSVPPTQYRHEKPYTTNQPQTCGSETDSNIYDRLNYGLYWFGFKNHCQQYIATSNNRYFDPTKKKVLFVVHGWMIGATEKRYRLNFDARRLHGPNVSDMLSNWLPNWNVGMFYWNQFADEAASSKWKMINAVGTAEAKIWSTKGPERMRWRDATGGYNDSGIDENMVDHFYQQYVQALANYQPNDIRLLGQSLGTQVVIALAAKIDRQIKAGKLAKNLLPTQVIIIDPAFSDKNPHLLDNGNTLMQQSMADVKMLKADGVVISGYRTSIAGHNRFMPDNTQLLQLTAFSDFTLDFYGKRDYLDKHTMGIWWYLLSMPNADKKMPSLQIAVNKPNAAMPLAQLRQLMGSGKITQTFSEKPAEKQIH